MATDEIHVIINGKDLELNNFARMIVGNTIKGMISALRSDEEPKRIEIRLEVIKTK